MIGYLRGRIVEVREGWALVAVSPSSDPGAGAVGYEVQIPARGVYAAWKAGQGVELRIHSHVREDAFDLYGFLTQEEKALFLVLIGVQGIGPRAALGILSQVEGGDFIRAVLEGDRAFLTSISGVGRKKAERLVIELADPLAKLGSFQGMPVPSAESPEADDANDAFVDARTALVGLGYPEADVQKALRRLVGPGVKPGLKAEELVRTALREL